MVGADGRAGRRVIIIAAGIVVALGTAVVIGSVTRWFGLIGEPRRDAASAACQDAVLKELASPSTARFDKLRVREESLSEDDHVRLGSDADKVTAVWAVAGNVTSPGRSGQDSRLEFACRAAFFDGQPIRTSISYGSADLPGQLSGHA
jgi:hypothetical protein